MINWLDKKAVKTRDLLLSMLVVVLFYATLLILKLYAFMALKDYVAFPIMFLTSSFTAMTLIKL